MARHREGELKGSNHCAVQESLAEAVRRWPNGPPDDPKAWLVTVAWRKFVDAGRAESSRPAREERVHKEPGPGPAADQDDTLLLLFLCCHPALSPHSAVALTLRAVGGLTTRQIAEAYLVPEPTMAQRISRAKRTVAREGVGWSGDLRQMLTVLYLVFNEGYSGEVELAAEAIRLTRALARSSDEPEVAGLLALMLLHHARLRELRGVPDDIPRRTAVAAWLHERAGDLEVAKGLYLEAAAEATNMAERTHLTRQAARLGQGR